MDADTIAKFFVRNIVLKVSGTTRYGIIPVDETGARNPKDDPPAHLLYNLLERWESGAVGNIVVTWERAGCGHGAAAV